MDFSKNSGTPKSSSLFFGCSIITIHFGFFLTIFGNTTIVLFRIYNLPETSTQKWWFPSS